MGEFSEKELHELVDKALGSPEPCPIKPAQHSEIHFPQLSFLEIELIKQFSDLMESTGVDSNVRSEILQELKGYLASHKESKVPLNHLRTKIQNCTKCSQATGSSQSSLGNVINPKVLFVLASVGSDLNRLTEYLSKYDFDKSICGITFVTRCPFAGNITESAINNCSDYLFAEIDYVNPEIIVPVGAIPLRLLVGKTHNLTDVHGHMFWLGIFKIFALFSPLYADKSNKQSTLEADLEALRDLL